LREDVIRDQCGDHQKEAFRDACGMACGS